MQAVPIFIIIAFVGRADKNPRSHSSCLENVFFSDVKELGAPFISMSQSGVLP